MARAAKVDFIALVVLVGIAAFFRLYRLHEVPMGLWRDEAANGLEALHVLNGDHGIFFGTREPMFIYLVAVSVAILGKNPQAIRVVAAIVGIATIPVTYLLVKELLRSTDLRVRVVASLTGLWLATSYWHINFSRLGFRGILLPLLASLSFYFLWRGWNELRCGCHVNSSPRFPTLVWFAVSGLCFGLTLYTYTPSRFLPLIVLLFPSYTVASKWRERVLPPYPSLLRAGVVFAFCFLLILAPLGMYFLTDAGSFLARSGVSVLNASQDEPILVLLAKNTLRQLAMFGFMADPNTRHDPAGRPAFDLFTLFFFLVGLAVSLHRREMPCLFALSWFSVMLLPAILTYPELPHFLRAIGTLPVAYMFPALGMERAWQWLNARGVCIEFRYAFAGLLTVSFLLVGVLTYRDYFAPVVEDIELIKAFDPKFVKAASIMNQLDEAGSVWVVALGPNGEQRMAYFVMDFLYEGQAPHAYVSVEEGTVAQELSEICQGHDRAMVLNTTEEYLSQPWFDLYSDSKGVIPFLLDKHGDRLERIDFDQFEILVYQLPENPVFSIADEFEMLVMDLHGELKLTGAASGTSSSSVSDAWVVLRWQAVTAPQRDYRIEVTLADSQGRAFGVTDKLLLSSARQPTSKWEAGQEEIDYYTLSGLPGGASRQYNISIALCSGPGMRGCSVLDEKIVLVALDQQPSTSLEMESPATSNAKSAHSVISGTDMWNVSEAASGCRGK